VLQKINFDALKGEKIGLIGPNGSGKTTLLKILGGLIKPSSGKILINGGDKFKNLRQYSTTEIIFIR